MNGSYSQTLGYDALDRLTSVASGAQTASYAYDADGNRTQQVVNGVTTHYSYPAGSNRLASSSGGSAVSYGYNAYGSTTTLNGLTAYTYDPFGRLANAGGAGFVVSAEDQRLKKTSASGTTYFVPDAGGAMLAESLNGTWYDYVWLNGRLVTVIANGGVFPVHADQTGRPLALTHPATQAILWQAAGLAFDRSVTQNNWGPFNVGFPGQHWDSEDGLWQNGYRDYDATTGRYIQSDPIGLAGGVNTYAYVGNNSISNVDQLGLCDDKKCGTPPKLPPGESVKANIQTMERLSAQAGASGDPFYTGLFSQFIHLVNYGGPWDYKTQDRYRGEYDAGGNFNYGAVGAAAGFSTPLLRIGAAGAQILHGSSHLKWVLSSSLGDQPQDVPQILAGIAYYQCMTSGGP